MLARLEQRKGDPLTPVTVQVAVHPPQVAYLAEHQRDFPGVEIGVTYLRNYNTEALLAHMLGYTGEISPSQLTALRKQTYSCDGRSVGYSPGDRIGETGVESQYDTYLRGCSGIKEFRVDSLGVRKTPVVPRQDAQPGKAIRLTIDISLQRAAERALQYGIGSRTRTTTGLPTAARSSPWTRTTARSSRWPRTRPTSRASVVALTRRSSRRS